MNRKHDILGTNVTGYDGRLPQNKLLSEEDVIRAFVFITKNSDPNNMRSKGQTFGKTVRTIDAINVAELIEDVYEKANILCTQ